ncbi:MAG: MBL fold metallo-hydrolase [Candidatus Cloacimonetes bacterium]|nr:MBL fold metallo-hydrolase [Candidatus Cloacimonadota bacterium]
MFQVSVLASGSKGNSFLIKTERSAVLLDAGLSGKKICEAIRNVNYSEDKIQGIIISHEHSDHIKGAGIICRKLKIPLYITERTYYASRYCLGELPYGVHHFASNEEFSISDIHVKPFPSSHDAADSCNFIFQRMGDDESRLAIITDLGYSSNLTLSRLKSVTTLIIESNHDEKMLLDGPYPWELKQRVKSKHGHLSNNQAKELVRTIMHHKLKNIILAHLSEQNNDPVLAYQNMADLIKESGMSIYLSVSSQNTSTPLIDV